MEVSTTYKKKKDERMKQPGELRSFQPPLVR